MTEKEVGKTNSTTTTSSSSDHGTRSSSSCSCDCMERLKTLEAEIKDFKSWKEQVSNFQRILDSLNEQVGRLIGATDKVEQQNQQENGVGGGEHKDLTLGGDELPPIDTSNGVEDVEITPDFFGHFLLDTGGGQQDDDDDIQEIELTDEEEVYDAIPPATLREIRKRTRGQRDDSDSDDCFTLSDNEDESSDLTSDDEYMPANKKPKGRGRGSSNLVNRGRSTHHPLARQQQPHSSERLVLDVETKKELMKNCKKRAGDIWECNVCGFMLSSLDNMLLHVKYNHSTTTHTCPFCKVVVLCRSPKDAVMHQVQCKLRPTSSSQQGATNKNIKPINTPALPPSRVSKPVVKRNVAAASSRVASEREIDARINKFVDELLDGPVGGGKKQLQQPVKKPPAVVTLSSDDEDEDEDDEDEDSD